MPSFKKSLIVEQFRRNYLKQLTHAHCNYANNNSLSHALVYKLIIGIFFIKYCLNECVSTKLGVTVNHVLVSLTSSFSLSLKIYIHPFTKTLLLQKYISYICMKAKKRLKQDGHTLHQPRGVAITCNFFFDMHTCLFWC